jgi:toxin-antitoxin system PIN domain toxin
MIIPDINLLLYAYDSSSQFHPGAVNWWEGCLSGAEPIGLPIVVALGFLRLGTHPRVFQKPMSPAEAIVHIRSWLEQPSVDVIEPGPDHLDGVMKLLEGIGTAGNLVTDAQIAALAIAYGAVLHTTDTDFQRFPDLRWHNPLTGISSRRPPRNRGPRNRNG